MLIAALNPATTARGKQHLHGQGVPFFASIDQPAGQLLTNNIGTLHSRLDIRFLRPWSFAHYFLVLADRERSIVEKVMLKSVSVM